MNLQDDRVMKFLDACYDAGIKRPEAFILSKMPQVYGWLKGAFPRGILPTDIDGEVEINGHFLRMEFKHESAMRNGRIPRGQHAALKALINTGRFTVLLVGTDDGGSPVCFEVWHHNGSITTLKEGGAKAIFDLCARWANFAENTQ
jgi:hypothetical protein